MFRQTGRVGEQMDAGFDAAGKAGKVALHHRYSLHDEPRVITKGFPGSRQLDATPSAADQRHAEVRLQALDPGARRCESKMRARRAVGNAAAIRHGDKKLKINQIKTHDGSLKSSW